MSTSPGESSPWSAANPLLRESWKRSRGYVSDPLLALAPITLDEIGLHELRREHPLAGVMPIFDRMLTRPAADAGLIVGVGDARGRLLWVDGSRPTLRRAESVAFQAGADWSERAIGTSAPGTALATGHGVQVHQAEHYAHHVQDFSCTAAPIRCPVTGEVLGVVDVTGGSEAVSTHSLPLILAAVDAAQQELRRLRAPLQVSPDSSARPVPHPAPRSAITNPRRASHAAPSPRTPPGAPGAQGAPGRRSTHAGHSLGQEPATVEGTLVELTVLGVDRPHLRAGSRSAEVTLRHAEILTLLLGEQRRGQTGHGMSAEALAEALFGAPGHEVSLRAEIVRLRRRLAAVIGAEHLEIASRPYRLIGRITSDVEQMLHCLTDGDRDTALTLWAGPLLPTSESPQIASLRREAEAVLRESIIQDGDAEQIWRYLEAARGPVDDEVLRTALQVLPADSPRRAVLLGRATAMQPECD